jgi:hypothetical protein
MAATAKIELNKLGAAKLQLETAIWLYFHNGDPVSVHTLAAAAVESIRPAAKKRGIHGLRNYGEIVTKPEHRKPIFDILKKAENFFKHGESDMNKTLIFDASQTDYVLFDGCLMYDGLASGQTIIMRVLTDWFLLNRPHIGHPVGDFCKRFNEVPTREQYFAEVCTALPEINQLPLSLP